MRRCLCGRLARDPQVDMATRRCVREEARFWSRWAHGLRSVWMMIMWLMGMYVCVCVSVCVCVFRGQRANVCVCVCV